MPDKPRTFKRMSEEGHAREFRAFMSTGYVVLKIVHPITKIGVITTLSKEDGRILAEWLLEKCK